MLIRIGYDIELALAGPTAVVYMLQVHPDRGHDLVAPEHPLVDPPFWTDHYSDCFGNRCARVRVPAGQHRLRLYGSATVRDTGWHDPQPYDAIQHAVEELPTDTLQFLLPSRYCEVDSELLPFAWNQFGHTPLGWARVQAISDYVHRHIRFDYGNADRERTALGGWRQGTGVCRDYAHLAVTLCRCMNIPARYVTGYLGDIGVPIAPYPMDFSAWFEVYLGGRWHTVDARHNVPRIGRIVIARGRDAADVPITMVFGQHKLNRFDIVTEEVMA